MGHEPEQCLLLQLPQVKGGVEQGKEQGPLVKFLVLKLFGEGTVNFQMFKLNLEKAKEPEIKLPTFTGSSKKQESSRKTSTSVLLTVPKPLTVWITTNCGKL